MAQIAEQANPRQSRRSALSSPAAVISARSIRLFRGRVALRLRHRLARFLPLSLSLMSQERPKRHPKKRRTKDRLSKILLNSNASHRPSNPDLFSVIATSKFHLLKKTLSSLSPARYSSLTPRSGLYCVRQTMPSVRRRFSADSILRGSNISPRCSPVGAYILAAPSGKPVPVIRDNLAKRSIRRRLIAVNSAHRLGQ